MPKWLPVNKVLQLPLTTFVFYILCLIAVITFFAYHGTYQYNSIDRRDIEDELHKAVNPNLVLNNKFKQCSYTNILLSTNSLEPWEVPKKYDDFFAKGIINGSYVPEMCNPQYSVAILVTYRNRQTQLDVFLPYMHNFLRKQNIHYRIYLIEQQDDKPWNKGLLYNIGAKIAIADKFPCLILHDVDLLPLDESNLYACVDQPRHLSASIDKFRYNLIYSWLVGGVLAITSDQYIQINGFSNRFKGWGGEDDDLSSRIFYHNLKIVRFPQAMSRYTMLVHPQESRNADIERIMAENRRHAGDQLDGYSSATYLTLQVKTNRLFTLLGVRLI